MKSGAPLDETAPDAGPFDAPHDSRYPSEGTLGRGGMGEVELRFDERLGRPVALKVANSPAGEAALIREARLTARLDHPGVVPIHDAGRLPDGRAYYTMPVLPGHTLAEATDDATRVRHVLDASRAVAHAHAHGVLHRDLKPENLLVGAQGETRVADWGLACELDAGRSTPGPSCGTAPFSSPEQSRGEALTAASDVYSLGRTLEHVLEVPSPELDAVIRRATAERSEDRYADAGELADDLLAWFEGRRVAAHDYSPGELLRRTLRAYRLPVAIGVLAVLAVAVAVGVSTKRVVEERDRAQRADAASRSSLAHALLAQARTASDADQRAHAELLAARALTLEELPEARGILARTLGLPAPLPSAGHAVALPVPDLELRKLHCDDLQAPLGIDQGVLTLVCSGTSLQPLRVVQVAGDTLTLAELSPEHGPPSALARDDARIAIGTEGGAVFVVHGDAIDTRTGFSAIEDLALSGERLAIGTRDGVHVEGHVLPPGSPLAWDGADLLVDDTRWSLPTAAPHRLSLGPGVAGLDVREGLVLTGHGDGQVLVHDLGSGERVRADTLDAGVAKDVAFGPDGEMLVGYATLDGARILDSDRVIGDYRVRRVVWGAAPIVGEYGTTLQVGDTAFELPANLVDLEKVGDGAIALLEDGGLFRVDTQGPTRSGHHPAVAVAAQDDVTVLATADTLVLLETGAWVELPDHPADLALRGDLVAVGLADGRILLHRLPDLEHVATLRGHTGRVAALAFDGDQLVSGSWDGDVRIWQLRALDGDVDLLLNLVELSWGHAADELFREDF